MTDSQATAAATKAANATRKVAAKPRRRAVKKQVSDVRGPSSGQSANAGQGPASRRDSARHAEQLAVILLAIVFGLIGFAVHILWFASIILMAILFGLVASEVRGRRGGGVISDVATTMVEEAKSVAEDIAISHAAPVEEADSIQPSDSATKA